MDAVASIGVPKMTVARVVAWLRSQPQIGHVPSRSTVRTILMSKFGMRFRAANAAKIKYNDTDFDEKRLWVSRLLT